LAFFIRHDKELLQNWILVYLSVMVETPRLKAKKRLPMFSKGNEASSFRVAENGT